MSERPPSLGSHVWALVALGVLLAASVLLAHFRLGVINTIAGPGIAVLKALVVLLIFMKLRSSAPGIRLAACFGFVWLVILIALTLGDFLTRVPVTVLP